MSNIVVKSGISEIQNLIFTFRGKQVMIDRDLAEMYHVETRTLNQAVKRNIQRFPKSFRFQLSEMEFEHWKSQIVMSNEDKMGLRRPPFAFTEQGVAMLSAVLKSKTAIQVSIQIMNAFTEMRKFIAVNASVFQRIDSIELKLLETDQKFEKIFKALESKDIIPNQGIFFDGQIFDAHKFVSDIIRSTPLLIIDNETVYHFGASLKDLGKKWFAFSKIDRASISIIDNIKELN